MAETTLHITELNTTTTYSLTAAFKQAMIDALANKGDMDPAVYDVEGFCGRKFRLFLNNLIRQLTRIGHLEGGARYLEVGAFKGATLCPVISKNTVVATAVDNWSWDSDGTVATTFYRNLAQFKNNNSRVSVIEEDFRLVTPAKCNVYFYDGAHSEKDQYDGIEWAMPLLDTTAIVLVDDWNWEQVRSGTMNALRDAGPTIEYMVELRTSFDGEIPKHAFGGSDWHNGFFGAVITKRDTPTTTTISRQDPA